MAFSKDAKCKQSTENQMQPDHFRRFKNDAIERTLILVMQLVIRPVNSSGGSRRMRRGLRHSFSLLCI